MLILYSGVLWEGIGQLAGVDEKTLAYGVDILQKLREAALGSPWIGLAVVTALVGYLAATASSKKKKLLFVFCILLFLPAVLIVFCFTKVNGVLTGRFIRALLPVIQAL